MSCRCCKKTFKQIIDILTEINGGEPLGDTCDNPIHAKICNIDDLVVGIEKTSVKIGCVKDADGALLGSVYACITTPEDQSAPPTVTKIRIDFDGTVTMPYEGAFSSCETCNKTPQLWKVKKYYAGWENTGTTFGSEYTAAYATVGGKAGTVTLPAGSGWFDQMDVQWEGALDAEFPTEGADAVLCEVKNHWQPIPNNDFADHPTIPTADFNFAGGFGQFIQFTACADQIDNLPASAEITHIDGVELKTPQPLIIGFGESDVEYTNVCVGCGDGCTNDEPPKCAIPIGESFPETPTPTCITTQIDGEWCDVNATDADDPNNLTQADVIASGIVLFATQCDGGAPTLSASTLDATDPDNINLVDYTVVGELRLCNDLSQSPEIPTAARPDCGNYTGRTFCYQKKSKLRLIEKQFGGANGEVDVSAEFGLPTGSIIAKIDTNLWTGANSDLIAVGPDDTATFSVSGSQPVCIRVQHGGSIPTDGGKDGFIADDGVPYTFTGNITGDGVVNQNGNTYAVKAGTDNQQGAINWTSTGPATSATAFTTNQNPLNAVRFWIATSDCSEAREWVSCDGTVCGWYDGKELVDITGLTESDCCDKPIKTALDCAIKTCIKDNRVCTPTIELFDSSNVGSDTAVTNPDTGAVTFTPSATNANTPLNNAIGKISQGCAAVLIHVEETDVSASEGWIFIPANAVTNQTATTFTVDPDIPLDLNNCDGSAVEALLNNVSGFTYADGTFQTGPLVPAEVNNLVFASPPDGSANGRCLILTLEGEIEEECAVNTVGCNDDRRDTLLEEGNALLEGVITECCDGKTVTYANSDEATELDISVGSNGSIKITSGNGDGSDGEITNHITDCLAAGNNVELTYEIVGGATGSVTLLANAQTNPFPNFFNQSTNATLTGESGSGKITTMTATCAGECKLSLNSKICNVSELAAAIAAAMPPAANTHLIEGCVEVEGEKVEAFTIVDDSGNPLFAPRPLTQLGFVGCC